MTGQSIQCWDLIWKRRIYQVSKESFSKSFDEARLSGFLSEYARWKQMIGIRLWHWFISKGLQNWSCIIHKKIRKNSVQVLIEWNWGSRLKIIILFWKKVLNWPSSDFSKKYEITFNIFSIEIITNVLSFDKKRVAKIIHTYNLMLIILLTKWNGGSRGSSWRRWLFFGISAASVSCYSYLWICGWCGFCEIKEIQIRFHCQYLSTSVVNFSTFCKGNFS